MNVAIANPNSVDHCSLKLVRKACRQKTFMLSVNDVLRAKLNFVGWTQREIEDGEEYNVTPDAAEVLGYNVYNYFDVIGGYYLGEDVYGIYPVFEIEEMEWLFKLDADSEQKCVKADSLSDAIQQVCNELPEDKRPDHVLVNLFGVETKVSLKHNSYMLKPEEVEEIVFNEIPKDSVYVGRTG